MRIGFLFIVGFLSLPMALKAQEKHAVKLLAKSTGSAILLRWAPSDAFVWTHANQQGYIVERYTIGRDEQLLPRPEKIILNAPLIKPAALPLWEKNAEVNDFSSIAAQAIYGSSFEVKTPSKKSGVFEMVSKTKELNQRFSFALFAADQSFRTAQLSGLAFKDSTARKNERYLYRVFVSSSNIVKADTGLFYIGLRDTTSAAAPEGLRGEFGNRVVRLHWPRAVVERMYTSFVIERSIDKQKNFERISKLPFVGFPGEAETEFAATDSLPSNDVLYYYRVRGVNPFGETGRPSQVISGTGFKPMKARPLIKEAKETANASVSVIWSVAGDEKLVKGFYLERSANEGGVYASVNKEILPAATRSFSDTSPGSTNYYRIKAVGEHGESTLSMPHLIQLADSIPPAAPTGLEIKIDTLGIVSLTWKNNKEKDLLGYRVFRSHFKSAEFSQISSRPVLQSSYRDTISLQSLTSKIYYKISAEDNRHNPSLYSEVVLVEKPDRVPPVAPSIHSIKAVTGAIVIKGIKSPSEDVDSYVLQRKGKTQQTWNSIHRFTAQDTLTWSDAPPVSNQEYYYSFIAFDKAGNRSVISKPVLGKALPDLKRKAIENITYEIDRTAKLIRLKWKDDTKGVSKVMIYRAAGVEPLSLYRTLPGSSTGFEDKNVLMDTEYTYRVKVVFGADGESGFSAETKMRY